MSEAVPGLNAAAARVGELINQFINLRDEGEGCQGRISAAVARVQRMTALALQGKPVDKLEISILQAQVHRDEARRADLLQQMEKIEREMEAQCASVDAAVASALRRQADIARAARGPGGRA